MNKTLIYILLLVLGVVIAYVILGDLVKNNMQKSTKNPYAFDLTDFEYVDPALVKYTESKRIKLSIPNPKAIDYHEGIIVLAFESQLQAIDTSGREIFKKTIENPSTAVFISNENKIYLGCKTHIEVYDMNGEIINEWATIDTTAYITSIARKDKHIFVANASEPEIIKYNLNGEIVLRFDGTRQEMSDFGFIIPSPYFDIHLDPYDELWIANTGLQNIQNYTSDGKLRAFWGNNGYELDDFTGCCNPAHFTILSDGSFVTCEKGLVRIKVHKPSGELDAFIAPPKAFANDSEPLDLTSDESDNIYALDITQKMVRKFIRK